MNRFELKQIDQGTFLYIQNLSAAVLCSDQRPFQRLFISLHSYNALDIIYTSKLSSVIY